MSSPGCRTAALPAPSCNAPPSPRILIVFIALPSCRGEHVCDRRWNERVLFQHSSVSGSIPRRPASSTAWKGTDEATRAIFLQLISSIWPSWSRQCWSGCWFASAQAGLVLVTNMTGRLIVFWRIWWESNVRRRGCGVCVSGDAGEPGEVGPGEAPGTAAGGAGLSQHCSQTGLMTGKSWLCCQV